MTWVVVENTPGYLPENDEPGIFEDLEDAKLALREDVQRFTDHLDEVEEPYEVHWGEDGMQAYVTQTEREHDLGRVFEVVPSEDTDQHIYA